MITQNQFVRSIYWSIRHNGLWDTIQILTFYWKFRSSRETVLKLNVSALQQPLYLRPGTSDFSVFRQIMMDAEYNFSLTNPPKTIIDAGANIGLASVYFSNRFPDAKIIAIEPDGSNFSILQLNVAGRAVTSLQAALWKSSGKLNFVEDSTADKWGLRVESSADVAKGVDAIDVPSLMNKYQLETIDLFKIDIEGSEYELFSGHVEDWIFKTKMIVIELHESMRPGCTKIFHDAISMIPHEISYLGENVIVRNLNFK